jgi:excisionase family DNA binding protein
VHKPQHIARRLLRLKPAAEYLALSTARLRTLIQTGELPAVITGEGAPWLVDIRDLDSWIEQKKARLG